MLREGLEFIAVSLGGMLIALGCLWTSHYVLELTSPLADNISTNVVGLVLGTAFRFVFYRMWVFRPDRAGSRDDAVEPLRAPEPGVAPSGRAPLAGVQYVAPVEHRSLPHD